MTRSKFREATQGTAAPAGRAAKYYVEEETMVLRVYLCKQMLLVKE